MKAASDVPAWQLKDIGPNSQVWAVPGSDPNGTNSSAASEHQVVELATGMNYWDGQQWLPSDPSFVSTENGFVAAHIQHGTQLATDLNVQGAVTVTTPDGITLQSTPIALGLYDAASGNYLTIATITNCTGVLMNSNQVVYEKAFAGHVCASILYTVNNGTLEQDVVITGRLDPADYGFPSETTRIQILTEFYGAPRPQKVRRPLYVEHNKVKRGQMVSPDLVDETLSFGQFVFGGGWAYTASTTDNPRGSGARVAKEFKTADDRDFLIESIPYKSIKRGLDSLPDCTEGTPPTAQIKKTNQKMSFAALPVPGFVISKSRVRAQSATGKEHAALAHPVGVVIDYIATLTTPTVLQADTTYLVSGSLSCSSLVIEGGCVVKYKAGTTIQISDSLTCNTTQYRPGILTCVDDDSVGDSLNGYSGSGYTGTIDTNGYANPALFPSAPWPLANLRICYAKNVVGITYPQDAISVSHSQLINCVKGFVLGASLYINSCLPPYTVSLNNVLLANVRSVCDAASAPMALNTFNCTIDKSLSIISNADPASMITSYNSIYANISAFSADTYGAYNGFYNSPTFGTGNVATTSPFQTVGTAAHYLNDASGFRDQADSGSVDPGLLSDLQQRTTYPPIVLGPGYYTNSTEFGLEAARDNDTLDLGYHYDVVDFAVSGVFFTNATATLDQGVVIAAYGANGYNYGFGLGSGAQLFSTGSPLNLNRIIEYNTVQEPGNTNWSRPTNGLITDTFPGTNALGINCRFTDWSVVAVDVPHIYFTNSVQSLLRDCQFHGGKLTSLYPTISLTNCLLERVTADLEPKDDQISYLCNNLIWNGSFSFGPTNSAITNNLFDQATIPNWIGGHGNTYSGGHNAYVTGFNRLSPTNITDIILSSSPAYETSTLGWYYLATNNTSLIHHGNTNANLVGFYHYTITTNQVKEATNIVSVGYHYIALGTNGLPIDTDGDGIPDYLEDSNGNGTYDSTVDLGNWTNSTTCSGVNDYVKYLQGGNLNVCTTLADTNGILSLQVYTPLK